MFLTCLTTYCKKYYTAIQTWKHEEQWNLISSAWETDIFDYILKLNPRNSRSGSQLTALFI